MVKPKTILENIKLIKVTFCSEKLLLTIYFSKLPFRPHPLYNEILSQQRLLSFQRWNLNFLESTKWIKIKFVLKNCYSQFIFRGYSFVHRLDHNGAHIYVFIQYSPSYRLWSKYKYSYKLYQEYYMYIHIHTYTYVHTHTYLHTVSCEDFA